MARVETGEEIRAADRAHVLHSWSVQSELDPVAVAGGEGSRFWDYDGKNYLDFGSQSVSLNVGHQHPRLVAAIKEQAERLCTISPKFANDARSELARLLAEVTPGDLTRTFFTNGGRFFRILRIDGPPQGDIPEAAEWDGVRVVEPV